MTREELIKLCEDSLVLEKYWMNRDSAEAQRQIGELWALLRAGCDFEDVSDGPNFKHWETIWIKVAFKGFSYFERPSSGKNTKIFYLPDRERLHREGDWY